MVTHGAAVAGGASEEAGHAHTRRRIYVIAGAGASILAAMSAALLVLCYRSSKVVTVRPWATGLSGQLQKAFVTGSIGSSMKTVPSFHLCHHTCMVSFCP